MTNTYRALTPQAEGVYAAGVFEHDFTPEAEQDAINAGLVEIVPRKYKVLSNNFEAGEQGTEIEGAYPVEIEKAYLSGGHLERIDPKPVAKKKADEKDA